MPVIPSVKYHLPGPDETAWRVEEYVDDHRRRSSRPGRGRRDVCPMPLEKDFSPTLAGLGPAPGSEP